MADVLDAFLAKQTKRLRVQARTVQQGENYIQCDFPSSLRNQLLAGWRSNLYTSLPSLLQSRNIGSILQTRSELLLPPTLTKPVQHSYQNMLDKSVAKKLSFAQVTSYLEYCMMCDWVIDSCLTTLSTNNHDQASKWHSLILPTQGIYVGQVILLTITLGMRYPEEMPSCQFLQPIPRHPLIHPQTGELDLKIKFPGWNPESHCMIQVLAFLRRIFSDPQYLTNLPPDLLGVKQSDFLQVARTQGIHVAAGARESYKSITLEEIESILRHLDLNEGATQPNDDESEHADGLLSLGEIQTTVENICNTLKSTDPAQRFRRGVHYRHDELISLTREADALYDLLIGAVATNA